MFAEYTGGVSADKLAIWTDTDYLMHVVTGAKTWHASDGVWRANPGEPLFVKKGANIVEQHVEKDVCLLTFFIPDHLIRSTVTEIAGRLGDIPANVAPIKSAT